MRSDDGFVHGAGLLEGVERLGGELGAVGVGAAGVVEAVGGLVAGGIVGQQFMGWSATARGTLRAMIEILYRDCQRFATSEIWKLVAEVGFEFVRAETLKSKG